MALDANLYTLTYELPSPADPSLTIKDPSGWPRYTCTRAPNDLPEELNLVFLDSMSEAELGSLKLLKARMALLTLNNPSAAVELYSSSRLSWSWSFKWEEATFTWKRDTTPSGRVTGYTLYVSRKSDADFPVCMWLAPYKGVVSCLQLLDYNLHRLDIEDRFGLDILMCFSVCRFLDWSPTDSTTTRDGAGSTSPVAGQRSFSGSSMQANSQQKRSISGSSIPLQPALRHERSQTSEGAPNEVRVLDSLSPSFLIEHCLELLKDQQTLFIELQAGTTSQANKAVHVAQEVRRKQAKYQKQDLFQYVKERSESTKKPPQQGTFDVASSLSIFLSRIPMDELAPKPPKKDKPPSRPQKLKLFGL